MYDPSLRNNPATSTLTPCHDRTLVHISGGHEGKGFAVDWKNKTRAAFLAELAALNLTPRTREKRHSHPVPMAESRFFEVHSRDEALDFVLDEWWKRFQAMAPGKTGMHHTVVPASPGMGKSRLLDVMAARPCHGTCCHRWPAEHSQWEQKCQAIDRLRTRTPASAAFCDRLKTATGVCATFNSGSKRSKDNQLLPNAGTALAVRAVWGHFFGSDDLMMPYETFAALDGVNGLDLVSALRLIAADCRDEDDEQLDIIFCVDELMLAHNGAPQSTLTEAVKDVLSAIEDVLDKLTFVHVIVTSLCYTELHEHLSDTKRPAAAVPMLRLEYAKTVKAVHQAEPNARWLSHEPLVDGTPRVNLTLQALRDCAGAPRLVEDVVNTLRAHSAEVESLEELQGLLWGQSVARTTSSGLKRNLKSALVMALSGAEYPSAELEPFCLSGLMIQSVTNAADAQPEIPALLLGVIYKHLVKTGNESLIDISRMLLQSCYRIMALDTLMQTANVAGKNFEVQVAHLLRIRILLRLAEEHTTVTLEQLLHVKGSRINPQASWRRTGKTPAVFELPRLEHATFDVHWIDEADLEAKIKRHKETGAVFIIKRDSYPGVDLFVLFPDGRLPAVQVKYSRPNSTTTLSNNDMKKSLAEMAKLPAATHCPAYAMFALRKGTQNIDRTTWAGAVHLPCDEVEVLLRDDVLGIIPLSLRARPLFLDDESLQH